MRILTARILPISVVIILAALLVPMVVGVTVTANHNSDGLAGYWNGDSDGLDLSGHGNDVSFFGDATSSIGQVGQAFSLDGSGDYVEAALSQTGAFTLSFWARTDDVNQSEYTSLFASSDASNFTTSFQIDFDGSAAAPIDVGSCVSAVAGVVGAVGVRLRSGSGSTQAVSASALMPAAMDRRPSSETMRANDSIARLVLRRNEHSDA